MPASDPTPTAAAAHPHEPDAARLAEATRVFALLSDATRLQVLLDQCAGPWSPNADATNGESASDQGEPGRGGFLVSGRARAGSREPRRLRGGRGACGP